MVAGHHRHAGFKLSKADGNVPTAFSIVLDDTGAVSYYNFAAEHHVATCQMFCDAGQQQFVVTKNGGQLDATVINDPHAWSGADAAYYMPGRWSVAAAVPEPTSGTLLLGGLPQLAGPCGVG